MDNNQPAFVSTQTADGVTWFALRDYNHRPEGLAEGTGCFLTYQSKNAAGEWGDWVLLNGGLIDMTPGKEQGDLDLLIHVNGQVSGMALVGDMSQLGGPPPGLVPITDRQMSLGHAGLQWLDLWLSGKLHIETVGKQIFLEGRWQWVDCIPVVTQQGTRYLPVYTSADGT